MGAMVLLALSLVVAGGGYWLRRRWFRGWEQSRIGAVDNLFSGKGLMGFLSYALFHLAWFMATAFLLILGLVYLTR